MISGIGFTALRNLIGLLHMMNTKEKNSANFLVGKRLVNRSLDE